MTGWRRAHASSCGTTRVHTHNHISRPRKTASVVSRGADAFSLQYKKQDFEDEIESQLTPGGSSADLRPVPTKASAAGHASTSELPLR